MQFQCRNRLVIFIALLITDASVAANVALSATPTSECTVFTTATTTVTSTIPGVASTSTSVVTATRFNSTVTVHITLLSSGATLSNTEYPDPTAGVSFEKRATSAAVLSSTTSRYPNSSLAVTPTLTEPQTDCLTSTLTTTLSIIEQFPGSLILTTVTSTFLTAKTLSITDYLDPATFKSTPVEPVTSSTAMLSPQPVSTGTSPSNTVSAGPSDEPTNTDDSIGGSTSSALPQNTAPVVAEPTSGGLVQGSSTGSVPPPVAVLTSPIASPTTIAVSIPEQMRTTTLSGIGPIVVDPSRSAIFISGAVSAITPGQQTTINNIPISFDTSVTFVVVDGTQTFGVSPSNPAPQPAPVVIGGTTIDLGQVATQLDPGQVTTVNGIPISLDASASNVVIGGTQTIPLLEVTQMPSASMVVVHGTTLDVGELASELELGEVTVIGTMTISRDTSALVAGTTTISLAEPLSDVVLGGTTITAGALPSGYSFIPTTAGAGLLLPNGQTLMPGAMTTISGIEISLMPGETPVVVVEGSMSITATSTVSSTSENFDDGGTLGIGQPTSTFTGDSAQFTGGAVATTKENRDMLLILAMAIMLFGVACF